MRVIFFQFRQEPRLREQEYRQVLCFSGLKKEELISVFGPKIKPEVRSLDGVDALVFGATGKGSITTDSAQMLEPWMILLREARLRRIPMIGFNYGAHLLTLTFGGVVTRDEQRKEIGSRLVKKTEAAMEDMLLATLPESFMVQTGHIDGMGTLPLDAKRLLSSANWENECWGIQQDGIYAFEFQLDLDQESLATRLIDYQTTYTTAPGELEHCILSLKPSPESVKILGLFFKNIVKKTSV